ncbi:chymotrypsin-1-like [Leptopilina boulardi]|uniref:chymotrypsin-1-like n=1 Tax=Leptopilina boulardi TaxID=63433 RepID=UPI0021F50EEC|nr:chymotrypsin-1-like [Leptopilina boulardi]
MSNAPYSEILDLIGGAPTEKIIGGILAQTGEIPYQVALRLHGFYFCGGAIISSTHILTAAHCVKKYEASIEYKYIEILSGTNNLKSGGNSNKIKSINSHPNYVITPKNRPKFINDTAYDIAIITLEKAIQFNDVQKSIKLTNRDDYNGYKGIVSGWGYTDLSVNKSSSYLKKLNTNIFSGAQCSELNTQICSRSTFSNGLCFGDSGSPLTVNGELVGIAAYVSKYGCASGLNDGFTKIFSYKSFIKEITQIKEEVPLNNYPNDFSENPNKYFPNRGRPNNNTPPLGFLYKNVSYSERPNNYLNSLGIPYEQFKNTRKPNEKVYFTRRNGLWYQIPYKLEKKNYEDIYRRPLTK